MDNSTQTKKKESIKDLRQTPKYANYIKSLGWSVEKLDEAYVFIKRFPVLGSIVKIQRPHKLPSLDNLEAIRKKHKTIAFYVEPFEKDVVRLTKLGFKPITETYLPSKTIRIALKNSDKDILGNMRPKTRYNINLARRKKVEVEKSKDIEGFVDFWQKQARKRGAFIPEDNYIRKLFANFDDDAIILNARLDSKVVASAFLLFTKHAVYYMYAASNDLGRKVFAPSLLVWESILLGKRNRKEIFDFDGIFDSRFPVKAWVGFSKFKDSFGGEEVLFPGTFRKFTIFRPLTKAG